MPKQTARPGAESPPQPARSATPQKSRPTSPAPKGPERQQAIADAAIRIVATDGLRALTHRAVDAEAGLPPGSTSYYLRTRDALLTACVHRMVERDRAAVGNAAGGAGDGHGAPPAPIDLPDRLTRLTVGLVAERREDLVARYQLSLEAIRRPDLHIALVDAGAGLRDNLGQLLELSGVPDAAAAAWPVAAMLDGLLYDRVAGAGSSLSDAEFAAGVRRAVTALLDGLRRPD